MIKRVATVTLTGTIQLLNAVGYLFGMIAALFGVLADCLDRLRTRINTPVDDDDDPYADIHNAEDPNITKQRKSNINE
mgnify:FL=1